MKTYYMLFLFMVMSIAADDHRHIEKLTTISGKTFTQVSVTKVTALEIRFVHANGIAVVPLTDLPPAMQTVFGYDPIAADFARINTQEERRQAMVAEEKRKAEQTALRIRQEAEHVAIQAIEKNAIKLSLKVDGLTEDGAAKCKAWGIGYKALDGKGRATAKKTMSGVYEKVEVLTALPVPGEPDSYMGGQDVIVHGIKADSVGTVVVMVVYPFGEAKKGEAQQYATDGSIAYGILKKRGAMEAAQTP